MEYPYYIHIPLRRVPLFVRCNAFAGMPKEATLNGSLTLDHTEGTREANKYRERTRKYNSETAFASMAAEIKSPSGNGPYSFLIYG
jgi:hypothetical protein